MTKEAAQRSIMRRMALVKAAGGYTGLTPGYGSPANAYAAASGARPTQQARVPAGVGSYRGLIPGRQFQKPKVPAGTGSYRGLMPGKPFQQARVPAGVGSYRGLIPGRQFTGGFKPLAGPSGT